MKLIFKKIVGMAVVLTTFIPLTQVHARTTSVDELPTPLHVTQTTAALEELGCAVVTERDDTIDTPSDVTYLVEPTDPQDGQRLFCTQDVLPNLTQVNGQVAGITSDALAAESNCLEQLQPNALGISAGGLLKGWRDCLQEGTSLAGRSASGIAGIGGNFALTTIIAVLQWLVVIFTGLGMLLLFGGVALVNFALSPTQFATHAVVQQMWPVILGVANLGFILALLAIAFGTVLQIQDFSARRMLPRLLFAALLINFSLLVGTLIVDASRLAMAIELSVLNGNQGVNDVTEVGNQILAASQLDQVLLTARKTGAAALGFGAFVGGQNLSDAWTGILLTIFAAILVWGTAIGFIIIGVMLVVRYIAILLLLIASPLAFLFIAVPRAEQLANRWWTEFIKYVLYGPVVLLILIILLRAQQVANFFGRIPQGQPQLVTWFTLVATTAVTIVLLYMAAVAGRYLGLAGAAATVGFVSGKAKQTARLYGGGVGLAAGAGAKLVERGLAQTPIAKTPAGRIAGQLYKGVKKAGSAATKGILGRAGETIVAGAETGSKGAQAATTFVSRQRTASTARTIDSSSLGKSQLHTDPRLGADKIANPDFMSGLNIPTLGDLITRGSKGQRAGIAASLASMKTAPANSKDLFSTVINKSISLAQASDTTINNPAATPAQQQAAQQDKEGALRILQTVANNDALVEKMDDQQRTAILESDDAKSIDNLLKSQANIRNRKPGGGGK